MQIQKIKRWKSWGVEVFSIIKKKKCRKIEQKKKDIILKVKINNFDLDIQRDTGCGVTLTPRNFWERIGKPALRNSKLLPRQFNGSVIKTLGYFEGSLGLGDKFEVISINVTTCEKNHGLLGSNVLNINSTILINEMKMEKNWNVKKTIKRVLKFKKVALSYCEVRKLPVHLLPLLVGKLRKLI